MLYAKYIALRKMLHTYHNYRKRKNTVLGDVSRFLRRYKALSCRAAVPLQAMFVI